MTSDATLEQELRDVFQRHEHLAGDVSLDDRPADDSSSSRPPSSARAPRSKSGSKSRSKGGPSKGGSLRRSHKDPRWARALVVAGALMMVLAGGAFVAKDVVMNYATRNVKQEDLIVPAAEQQGKHVTISGAKNILLMGIDPRPGQDESEAIRSDSIIILHIPASHDSAYLVSIPRDTWVKIPKFDNGKNRYTGGHDKINGAFAIGGLGTTGKEQRKFGVTLLAETIEENWGITFDAAAIIDFTGFQNVVNVLGGVDMYVDQEVKSVHIGHDAKGETKVPFIQRDNGSGGTALIPVAGVTPQTYHVGYQHLEPWQALDYVRQRETLPNSDYDRQRHQQQFIKALFKQILSKDVLTDPGKLKKVLDVIGQSMTIDSGGIGLDDWIFAMKGISGDSLLTVKTNNGTFFSSSENPGAEALDPTTLELLAAVKGNTLEEFMAQHTSLISS
ncbi:LCP family protein [Dactylosporangium sp. NBC_01737]|uniref:LCP family protein n=1 Tax=Dactylosporangium sp. NBC_01737 TaxID=2975959 RepID=UPI002E148DF1|nr:LCP family protein [Dactylosporangium sp. NBC_01737]